MEEKSKSLVCEEHPRSQKLFYCKTKECSKLICEDCLPSHSRHNFVHLLELANEMKTVQEDFMDLGKQEKELLSILEIFKPINAKMDPLLDERNNKLREFQEDLKTSTRDYNNKLILTEENIQDAIDRKDTEKMREIIKQYSGITKVLKIFEGEGKRIVISSENLTEFHTNIQEKLGFMGGEIGPVTELRVLLLGHEAAGKTTFLYKLKLDANVTTVPTIGIYIYIYIILGFNVESVDYHKLKMTIWDVGGQPRIRELWRHYYQDTNLLLFMLDSSNRDNLPEIKLSLEKLMNEPELASIPILILANKMELEGAANAEDLEQALGLEDKEGMWKIIEISAINEDQKSLLNHFEWVKAIFMQ